MKRIWLLIAATGPAVFGCDRSLPPSNAQPSAAAHTSNAIAGNESASSSSTRSPCPRTGQWAFCSVEGRLTQSGFVITPVEGAVPRRAGFSVAPKVYTVGHSHLEVFLYPDSAALAKDLAGLDTLTAAPRGVRNPWPMPPTFVRSANLLAVLLTDSPVQAERFNLVITAGAPPP